MEETLKVAVIGGGAAGFFSAISVKAHHPAAQVTIYEKTSKLLAKVKISGGGRCNVTNDSASISEVSKAYPRGAKLMKRALKVFNTTDTRAWFESRGVALKSEPDGRVFPVSDDSQSIIDCLMREVKKKGITIKTSEAVLSVDVDSAKKDSAKEDSEVSDSSQVRLGLKNGEEVVDKVIIATGGSPKADGFKWLKDLGHEIVSPLPSLFTFNMPKEKVIRLMGVVADEATVSIQGTKLKSSGPLLITHWGMSGPAILKLSAFGARTASDLNYNFKVNVNWVSVQNQDEVQQTLNDITISNPKKQISNVRPYGLAVRLWEFLIVKADIPLDKPWQEIGKKAQNKLATLLTRDTYQVTGKTTFKEEFVTCGGVSRSSIDATTMQSKHCPAIFFAGEVLDIDGITGGYNFQAAWATGFIAGKLGMQE